MGRAGVMGLEKAVEVLDTLGSSMTRMNPSNAYLSGVTSSRGGKVTILAFEVANTIAKGAALLQSLSEENLKFMKKDMLHSEEVKKLVSTDTTELQILAASDKRFVFYNLSPFVSVFGSFSFLIYFLFPVGRNSIFSLERLSGLVICAKICSGTISIDILWSKFSLCWTSPYLMLFSHLHASGFSLYTGL